MKMLFSHVSSCVCMCKCVCERGVHACVGARAHVEARGECQTSCSTAAYLLKQDLPLKLKLDWQSVLGFPVCSQQCLAFSVGTGDLNSGSNDCTVSEHLPSLQRMFSKERFAPKNQKPSSTDSTQRALIDGKGRGPWCW